MRKLSTSSALLFVLLSVIAATASAQFLPGDASSVAAAGRQAGGQIARGGNGYLVVWSDTRSVLLPGFLGSGGPYSGPGLGTMTDIYAARLSAAGAPLDPTPIVITESMYNQSNPVVGWNGQNWLIAWTTERATNRYYYDILATRVAPDGSVLDDPPLLIYSSTTTNNVFMPYAVATDGTNWTVAYRGLDAGIWTINGVRVAPDGTILDPGGKLLREDSWNSGATKADLAFAGDEYLMTWLELDGTGSWMVKGQLLSSSLNLIGSVFPVDLLGFTKPDAPRVASNGTDFLAVWFENRNYGAAQIFGTRVSHSGQVLDPNGIAVTGASGYSNFAPDVAWDGNTYLVAYNDEASGFDEDIYLTRVISSGAVLDPNGILVKGGPTNQNEVSIAAAATGGAQIIWTDPQTTGTPPEDIATAAVSSTAAVGASSIVSRGAPRQRSPRMAFGGNEFLAVFTSESSGSSRILAQRVDAWGKAIDIEPIVVASGTATAANPSVAWNGTLLLIVWQDNGQIYGRQMMPDGTLGGGAALPIMRGNDPDVAALGDTFLVVSDDAPVNSQYRFIFGTLVSAAGTVGTAVQISGSFSLVPRVAALGSRWLVVWEGHPTHDDPTSAIYGAFVDSTGALSAGFAVSDGGHDDTPALAANANSALIVWADADIFGRRILADGTLLDTAAGLIVSSAPGSQFAPAVAWDGSEFVVDWLDERNDPYPNQERGDIYAARVSASGSVLDPNGFAVAASPAPEENPTVAAGGGATLFGYAAFHDEAPFAAHRVSLRRFPFNQQYSLAVSPGSQTVYPGSSVGYAVAEMPIGAFNDPVTLSVYGLPAGASATLSPASLSGAQSATLSIATGSRTPSGTYTFTVVGADAADQATATAVLVVGSGTPSCVYTLSYSSIQVPASGASAWFTVSTTAGCPWTAASNVPWITITAGAGGTGPGEVDFTVTGNTLSTSRNGTITAAGQIFTVYQSGASCSYSISPASLTAPAAGTTDTVYVNAPAGCPWTAVSNVLWITIIAGSSGSGSWSVGYTVAVNSSTTERSGTMTIAGQTFTVTQPPLWFGVSGQVVTSTGPLAKVKLTFALVSGSGSVPASVQTDSNGNWTQTGFQSGATYSVTPGKQKYVFTPASRTFSDGSTPLNFSAAR